MSRTTEEWKDIIYIAGTTYSIAMAVSEANIRTLLRTAWEPYAYADGVHYFKKRV